MLSESLELVSMMVKTQGLGMLSLVSMKAVGIWMYHGQRRRGEVGCH